MRIVEVKTFRADGGWRPFSFLKIVTDAGLVGWSEFAEGSWSPALAQVIEALGRHVTGQDPRRFAWLSAQLRAMTQFTAGGLSHQAASAIENACMDIAAKAAGVPVSALFGGPIHTAIDLYCTHVGSFRVRHPVLFEKVLGKPPLRCLADLGALTRELVARGFKAMKTNPIFFESDGPALLNPGFVPDGMTFARTLDDRALQAIADQMYAMRMTAGADCGLMLDVNFSLGAEALRRLARKLEPACLRWLEVDLHAAAALGAVRADVQVPIASLESIYGCRAYKPYFDAQSVDVAIVDVVWNGFQEAMRIAALANTYDVNVAPHNFYGPLADLMNAHFCATIGNVAIMEIEADDVPWKAALLTHTPKVENGQFIIPSGTGWGADVNEEALQAHPWLER